MVVVGHGRYIALVYSLLWHMKLKYFSQRYGSYLLVSHSSALKIDIKRFKIET